MSLELRSAGQWLRYYLPRWFSRQNAYELEIAMPFD